MNRKSLNLIHDVIINSGKWALLEIVQGSVYIEFKDVELGKPKGMDEMSLTVRFGEHSFFSAFYNNIWDIDFLSGYNYDKQFISQEVYFPVKDIRFIDFQHLNSIFHDYKNEKTFLSYPGFSIHNIRNDFFMLVETRNIAFVAGGNQMDFFTPSERLDDLSLKNLSNEWMLYFLNYQLKRNLIKDPMCENHPFRLY